MPKKIQRFFKKSFLIGLIFAFSAFAICVVAGWMLVLYQMQYKGKIYPYIFVQSLELSGLNKQQAAQRIKTYTDALDEKGITLTYQGKSINVPATLTDPLNPDLSTDLFAFDVDAVIEKAYAVGRGENSLFPGYLINSYEEIQMLWDPIQFHPVVVLQETALKTYLHEQLVALEEPPVDARFQYHTQGGEVSVDVVPDQDGYVFDTDVIFQKIQDRLLQFSSEPIVLERKHTPALIQEHQLLPLATQMLEMLKHNYRFTFENKQWWLSKAEITGLMEVDRPFLSSPRLSISQEKLEKLLNQRWITQSVAIDPVKATFALEQSRVTQFQPGVDGREIDVKQTKDALETALFTATTDVSVINKVVETPTKTVDANSFGIVEKVAEGKSNFYGSPANRRHNIATGAAKLNGFLILPQEEFSMIKALGKIDEASGYKPELVIKGDRTVPEFGGGLCQIGTTMFRAALNAGLPITERRNHSYRVRYYEPAGTDATIYDPSPDFKFLNDTPGALLVLTKLDGNDVIFELWGKKDGRTVVQTTPKVYAITKPGEPKYIESEDLKPGEEKCIETPHDGATAEFDYTVTYADSTVKFMNFKSYYKPWPKVCLRGKPLPETLLEVVSPVPAVIPVPAPAI